MSDKVTLEIGTWYSTCSACRGNADPSEKAHVMENMNGEGCGATFTHVREVYFGMGEDIKAMRPDLTYDGYSSIL